MQDSTQESIVTGMTFKQDFDIEEVAARGSDTVLDGELIVLVFIANKSNSEGDYERRDLALSKLNTDTFELVKYDSASDTYSLKTLTNLYLLPEYLLPTKTISNVYYLNVVPQQIYNIHLEQTLVKQDGSIGGKKVRAGDEIKIIMGTYKTLQKQELRVTYHLTSHRWYVSAEAQKNIPFFHFHS